MAIDNTLYDSLENTHKKIQAYLDTVKLGREHSEMMMKHEELAELLEKLDIEAIEEQWTDINALHKELDSIKDISTQIVKDLSDGVDAPVKVVRGLDEIFLKVSSVIV